MDNEISWSRSTFYLCMYGFFKDMKPSEPFLVPYLNSSYKHISEKDISDKIYPVATYSYLAFLFLVFLLTDVLRYKPLIVVESLAYLSTRVILIWGNGVQMMQLMQLTYGLATATEIAYYSYIYAMVDETHYRKVTSYTRAVTLLGRGFSDVLAQVLISTHATNYLVLNYISLGSVSIAVFVALFLPKVKKNVFLSNHTAYDKFENSDNDHDDPDEPNTIHAIDRKDRSIHAIDRKERQISCYSQWKLTLKKMFVAFKSSYSKTPLLMWSLWWAFAMCGGLQVEGYVMNLWLDITGSNTKKIYNGGVFAFGTLLSALVVYLFSFTKVQWKGVWSELLIGAISLLDVLFLLTMAHTNNAWIAYAMYVVFRASYAFVLTVASYQIAMHVEMQGYGLIFGWNTFLALCLQSLITLIFVDEKGLDLGIKEQFVVYGVYFGVIGAVFLTRPIFFGLKFLIYRLRKLVYHENEVI